MNSSRGIVAYYRTIYQQSNKWVMPVIAWVVFLYLNYLVMPQEFTSTMLNSATGMFLLTAWVSQTFLGSLTPVMEQIIVTRLPKKEGYWAQTLIFVSWLSLLLSLVSVALPLVINLVKSQGLFRREITLEEMISALLIHVVFCLIGGLITLNSQPRYLFRDGKLSNLFLVLVGLISVVGHAMAAKIPGFQFILWLFPPLSKVTNYFLEKPVFTISEVLSQLIGSIIYIMVLIVVYRFLRRKFLYE